MQISRARMETPISTWRSILIAARTDDGEALGAQASSAFLAMRSSGPRDLDEVPPEELDTQTEMLFWDFLGRCDLRHLSMLREAEAEAAERVASEQARGEKVLAEADAYVAGLRRQRRSSDATEEQRGRLSELIHTFEEKQTAAAAWLVRRLAGIRESVVALEADVVEALQNHGEVEELYTVRWTARHPFDRIYSGERPDSFFLGPNPPRYRNRTAEARLAQDRQYDDETDEERRTRLDLLKAERRREWAGRMEERKQREAEKRQREAAARAEFAAWVEEQEEQAKQARHAAKRLATQQRIERARELVRAEARVRRAGQLTAPSHRKSSDALDEAARATLEGITPDKQKDIDEFHDWMKDVGLV